jgi:hypothetical protein
LCLTANTIVDNLERHFGGFYYNNSIDNEDKSFMNYGRAPKDILIPKSRKSEIAKK